MTLFRRTPRLAPGDLIDIEGRPVRLRVDARARRISLRLDSGKREVVATAPSARALSEAASFAASRADWIAGQLAALPAAVALAPGQVLQVQGAPLRLERAAMRIRPRLVPSTADEPARLIVSGQGAAYARAAERALRGLALERLRARTAVHCAALDQPVAPVAVMAAKGRWGSCRPATARAPAAIRYNWRLILAPPAVLDYVVAHEVAHLVEANHSPAFWAVVDSLYGDPRAARAWLRANGARLQAIGA